MAAIQPMNFPALTPEQTNPFIYGMMQGQQYVQNQMVFAEQLREKQLQNQMMEQQFAEEQLTENQQKYQRNSNTYLKIMIFSQNKYPSYLGCFNCSIYMKDSIHNDGNSFGNRNGRKSIFNAHGIYGSTNSDLSVCNRHALHPPIIVDNEGVIYGLLTLNTNLQGAITEPSVIKWLRTHVCTK